MSAIGAEGSWQGSLVDACGYEGSLELDLTVQGDQVSGRFRVAIADRGEPFVCDGELSGTDGEDLELQFASGPEGEEVRVTFRGSVFGLADGGAGLCGNYDVSAQAFSPFRAGVVALSRDMPIPTVEVEAPSDDLEIGGG